MNTIHKNPIINGPQSPSNGFTFEIRNESTKDAAEIDIFDVIGKDWWSDSGTDGKSFSDQIAKIPEGRKITVRINSMGGNVFDGISIYTQLRNRRDNVTCYIIGAAISIASVIALAGSKVKMARAAQFMIHDPSTVAYGTVADMEKAIAALKSCKESILTAYCDRTQKDKAILSDAMTAETWFTGETAKAYGFVDEVTDDAVVNNTFDISNAGFRNIPEAWRNLQNSAAKSGGQNKVIMTKEQIIALLAEHGITAAADATLEQLIAQLKAIPKAKKEPVTEPSAPTNESVNRIKALEDRMEKERLVRIENQIDQAISDRRIPVAQKKAWLDRAVKDETVITDIQAMPQNLPSNGIDHSVELVSTDPKNIAKHIMNLARESAIDSSSPDDRERSFGHIKAKQKSRFIRKHEAALIQILNTGTNTIDSTLQQDVLMDIGLRAYARVLAALSMLSTSFNNVALKGTDKVTVPFLDLDSTTPTDWVAATGYVAGDTTRDKRQVTVNKRKYLGMSYTSSELARQPFLMVSETFALKGEQLAYQIWLDILSIFVVANYANATAPAGSGATSWPLPVASWDSNKINDLRLIANTANWPIPGRILFANGNVDNQLMKDNSIKLALNIGTNQVQTEGRVPDLFGFKYVSNVNLPANSASLAAIIAWKTAVLIATAPIPPTQEVIRAGTNYSLAVDPDLGIALEMRSFGDNTLDTSKLFIEGNYGYAKGNASAAFLCPTG